MLIEDKIAILANGAKYDVSCSSSGSTRTSKSGSLGNTVAPGICHSWSEDGRCISLLKILMSNDCIYNCAYCINRKTENIPRATMTAEELVKLTIGFYKRNYIEGLFLSSAVVVSPNHTMEAMLEVVKRLRLIEKFRGYIHLKGIPGCSQSIVDEVGVYVDRLSFNLELATEKQLILLAPQKNFADIINPMHYISNRILDSKQSSYSGRQQMPFVSAGQTSQMMIGTGVETDYLIMKRSDMLYEKFNMKRVYYSAYLPVVENNGLLPTTVESPLLREHRLYQADWLLRFYGFSVGELLSVEHPNFDLWLDPKAIWALRNINNFPIDIAYANYDALLRVPGIGPLSAKRIIASRKHSALSLDGIKRMGVVVKRAKYFITINGISVCGRFDDLSRIKLLLCQGEPSVGGVPIGQVSLLETHAQACALI